MCLHLGVELPEKYSIIWVLKITKCIYLTFRLDQLYLWYI